MLIMEVVIMKYNLDNIIAERPTKTVYKDNDKTIKLFQIWDFFQFSGETRSRLIPPTQLSMATTRN